MAFCPNTNSKEWKDLVSAQGENMAYLLWDKYKGNIPSMFYLASSEQVAYTPKIVTALAKAFENRKTIRVSTEDQKTNIRKYLAGQGVPSEQINLMFSYLEYTGQTEAKTDDLIVDLLASYSYAIEINIAKDKIKDAFANVWVDEYPNKKIGDYITIDGQEWKIIGKRFEDDSWGESRLEEREAFIVGNEGENTKYYSNLTVPGGTNYTEQELATPEITPAIKGHAQFATDQGIGWFRSDKQKESKQPKYYLQYGSQIPTDTNIQYFNSKKEAQKKADEYNKDDEYGIWQVGEEKVFGASKTRRILEVQSDLFQKGRNKEQLVNSIPRVETGNMITNEEDIPFGNEPIKEYKDDNTSKQFKSNQFLQLLNKDNNWVTFFVKSIVQDSAKQGYEKVLFPSGDTASKVEGHTTLEEFKKQKELRLKQLLEQTDDDKKNYEKFGKQVVKDRIDKSENEINQLKQELARVEGPEGFGALAPIYNFYQNVVSAVLKKQGFAPKTITDEYGNKWFEVDLTSPKIAEKASASIAFRTSAQAAGNATINTARAKAWVQERFGENSVSIFESAQAIGDLEVHGYVENGLMHLWSSAEVGTEFHEAYHLVFRTMLSEEQRAGLYAEAEKTFGKPTASEIDALKKQFPNISNEEAYKLALEEKMSEEFREYMLTEGDIKSLPAKIGKFFRDLWNYIKAMFSDSLGLKQVYSLISSNKMNSTILGRGVFRNPQKFIGNNRANLARPGVMGPELVTEVVDTLYSLYLKEKKDWKNNFKPTLTLGSGTNKGSIANAFLLQIYSRPDGSALEATKDLKGAMEVLEAEEAYSNDRSNPALKEALKQVLAKHNMVFALGNDSRRRTVFKNIYTTWGDIVQSKSENVIQTGWRTGLVAKLTDAGIYIDTKTKYDTQIDEADENDDADLEEMNDEFAVIDGAVGKIYGQSSMEISPAKRLTARVKELLSSIRSTKENSLGYYTFLNRDEVFKELLGIFSGKQTYTAMKNALEQEVKLRPHLQPVADFLRNLSEADKAMIFSAFALSNTEFMMLKQKVDDKTNYVEVFNPNRKDIPTAIAEKWKANLVSEVPGAALYKKDLITKEDGTQLEVLTVDKIKVLAAAKAWKEAEKLIPKVGKVNVARIDGQINPIVEHLTNAMWNLGMYVGNNSNIADTQRIIQMIADNGIDGKSGEDSIRLIGNQLLSFIRSVADFTATKESKLADFVGTKPTNNKDYISARKSVAIDFAKMFKGTIPIAGISFVNGKGKAIYGTNTETHMAQIVNILKERTPKSAELLKEYLKDEFINVAGRPEFMSVLFKHLSDPKFLEEFGAFDFDASKLGLDSEEALAYEDFSEADTLVTLVNAFINNRTDSEYTYIAVPVQSDRDKFTFIKVPRLSRNAFGKQFMSHKDLIKAQIVQDLVRVAQAKSVVRDANDGKIDYSELEEGYHTAPGNPTKLFENGEYVGNAFKEDFFQFRAKNKDGKYIVTDETLKEDPKVRVNGRLQMSDKVMDYVNKSMDEDSKKAFDARLDRMTNEMLEFFDDQATKLEAELKAAGKTGQIGISGAIGVDMKGLLKGFVVENAIMRNEIVKLFRGNRALHKNQEDFYKRMGHLTTPGNKMAMLGDVSETYGMMLKFNEIAMRDVKLNLTDAQKDEANEQADNIYTGLVNSGVSATEAEQIADAYRPGEYDSTDAQAFISLDMHRSIQQGLGRWEVEDEAAYKAYKVTGEFVYQEGFVPEDKKAGDPVVVLAHKGYFEKMSYNNNTKTLSVDSQKNSYSVLLKSYTKNFPFLEDLRRRMEATDEYAGQQPVHVVNFVSGKKLSKKGIYKHTGRLGELGDAVVNTHDSSGLRFPQFIPSPKEEPTNALNRQIKKNMVANVEDSTMYEISPGILNTQITGKDLKELYHAAIEEKLARDMDKVEKEMGLADLYKAAKTNDLAKINEAKLAVLKKVREKVLKQAEGKELHSNYKKALDIVFDTDGSPRFTAPLDIPLYNKKYESIIMSVINNEVFKQKVKGFEAVQIAQLGGSEADGSGALKFLQISEDGRRVIHAEIMIREDVARKFGIEPGQSLDSIPEELRRVVGYRIPNQDKASVVLLKIAKVLPANSAKAVVVPGQLLKLMGSDHDVDKLNLLFPEVNVNKETGTITKVAVDYASIVANKNLSKVSNAQLNNIILDLMEAVYTNPAHFKEVFTPLDDTSLTNVVDEIKGKVKELSTTLDWSDYKTEAITARRSTLGNKLRGIYANALAARNVLQHGKVRINSDFVIKINEKEYKDYINEAYEDPFNTASRAYPTDKSISLFLSAAVDAAKTPVQYELNDTVLTSRVRVLFSGFFPDYSSRYCSLFLNQPLVKEFTSFFETNFSGNLRDVKMAYKEFIARYAKDDASKFLDLNKPGTYNMSSTELENLSKENRDLNEQFKMLANFMKFYEAGGNLMKLGKRVTPDSMDGLGRLGSIQSYLDRANRFDQDEDSLKTPMFYEPGSINNVTEQFIGEKSIYGLERGYENLLLNGLDFAGVFFPTRMSPAVLSFKKTLLEVTGQNEFTPEMHQLIDYNLMFIMMMREGSPFAEMMNNMQGLYSNSQNNIYTRLQSLKERFPALNTNPFVANLEPDTVTEASYYGIKFDNTFKVSASEKQAYTDGLYNLLYNPQFYINTDKTVDANGQYINPETKAAYNEIKRMGINLAMHSFFVNGFRQGASSYADIVPIEFFTTPMKVASTKPAEPGVEVVDRISLLDFFRQEASKAKQADYFTGADMVQYLGSFGKMRAGGSNLLDRVSVKNLSKTTKTIVKSSNKNFVVARNSMFGQTAVFAKTGIHKNADGSVSNQFSMISNTFSAKGTTKLYGFNYMRVLKGDIPLGLLQTVENASTYLLDKGKLPNESGNMACSI